MNRDTATEWSLPCRFVAAGRFAATTDVNWHVHAEHELVMVLEGACRFGVGRDLWLEGNPGSLCVLPAGLEQYVQTQGAGYHIYVLFEASLAVFEPKPRLLEVPLDSVCARLFARLLELHMNPAPGETAAALDALLLALLEEARLAEHQARKYAERHPAVRRAVAFMEARLDRALTVGEIARAGAVSPSHLNALFQAQFGAPPLRMHTRWRLDWAARLLRERACRTKELAGHIGFDDTNYFVRLFRNRYGLPPGAWLRRQRTPDAARPESRSHSGRK